MERPDGKKAIPTSASNRSSKAQNQPKRLSRSVLHMKKMLYRRNPVVILHVASAACRKLHQSSPRTARSAIFCIFILLTLQHKRLFCLNWMQTANDIFLSLTSSFLIMKSKKFNSWAKLWDSVIENGKRFRMYVILFRKIQTVRNNPEILDKISR